MVGFDITQFSQFQVNSWLTIFKQLQEEQTKKFIENPQDDKIVEQLNFRNWQVKHIENFLQRRDEK